MHGFVEQLTAVLLVSFRITPTLAFSYPFTLVRVPAPVRILLGISLAAWLVAGHPVETWQGDFQSRSLLVAAGAELLMGIGLALALQLAFGALLTAGRMLDIQSGLGLAVLVDPTSRAQLPLIGTLLAYAAGLIFFSAGGAVELLAIWSASVEAVPIGALSMADGMAPLVSCIGACFVLAFGIAGLLTVVLFIIDVAIAFMSRTLPQMNVLILGFQVKTLVVLATLPIAISISAVAMLRLLRFALETMPTLV